MAVPFGPWRAKRVLVGFAVLELDRGRSSSSTVSRRAAVANPQRRHDFVGLVGVEFGLRNQRAGVAPPQDGCQVTRPEGVRQLLGHNQVLQAGSLESFFQELLVAFGIAILGEIDADRWRQLRVDAVSDGFAHSKSLVPHLGEPLQQALATRLQRGELIDKLLALAVLGQQVVAAPLELCPLGGLPLPCWCFSIRLRNSISCCLWLVIRRLPARRADQVPLRSAVGPPAAAGPLPSALEDLFQNILHDGRIGALGHVLVLQVGSLFASRPFNWENSSA